MYGTLVVLNQSSMASFQPELLYCCQPEPLEEISDPENTTEA
jgi:hypothetical protein